MEAIVGVWEPGECPSVSRSSGPSLPPCLGLPSPALHCDPHFRPIQSTPSLSPQPAGHRSQAWQLFPTFSTSKSPSSLGPSHLSYLVTQFPLPPSTQLHFTAPSTQQPHELFKSRQQFSTPCHGLAPAHLADAFSGAFCPSGPLPRSPSNSYNTPHSCLPLGLGAGPPAPSYLSIPSSELVPRGEASPDHRVHIKTASLPTAALHPQLQLTACLLIDPFSGLILLATMLTGTQQPCSLLPALSGTCSKYLLNKASEREEPCLL